MKNNQQQQNSSNNSVYNSKRDLKNNEKHIESFIQSISPFKDPSTYDLMMKKEKSAGLHNFLPSLNEHK